MELLFPFETQRPVQKEMSSDVAECIAKKKHIIAHAPTGLGKTAAALLPALEYAIKNGKNVIFLTPKHTQHQIVIETLRKVKERNKVNINVVDFIGKRWMCLVSGVQSLKSGDFAEYCREMKKEERCPFYNKVWKKNEITKDAENMIGKLKNNPLHVEEMCKICAEEEMCPYEISCQLAKSANVLIADYYHVFHPSVVKSFLMRTGKRMEDCIIVVDEAQNLPDRIREVLSNSISNFSIERAINEARKFEYLEVANQLTDIYNILVDLSEQKLDTKKESLVSIEEFKDEVEKVTGMDFETLAGDLMLLGEKIRTENKRSYIGSMGVFMQLWPEEGEERVRIIKKNDWNGKKFIQLSSKCLDPALSSKQIFKDSHSAILMSGTLTPTRMYRDVLGMESERTVCKEYENSFPNKNRLSLIIPDTTTKFTRRSPEEFQKIADWCAQTVNAIPGNVAVFFPSYNLRDKVSKYFEVKSRKSIFSEQPGLSKLERLEMLEQFKSYSDIGAVFMGVTGGSFGEGIDLPGKLLNGVVIVGVPLDSPDLETQSLIDYYDKLFGAGWDYGYIFPAMNRVVQAAGRAIRSETDKGVIVLLDERFTWKNYFKCLPIDWRIVVTFRPIDRILKFVKETKF